LYQRTERQPGYDSALYGAATRGVIERHKACRNGAGYSNGASSMTTDDLLDWLADQPDQMYSYVVLAVLAGPTLLRLFGLRWLATIARPLALALLFGGVYAKQRRR
jgi:hypothetical protein